MAKNLVLVGFMASGKSSVGRIVADQLDVEFIDLDEMVEGMTGKTISELFDQQGEARFRRFESAALAQALAGGGKVVAVGGGAVIDDRNWELIEKGANVVVRLAASGDEILRRLDDGGGRPLAGGGRLRERPDLREDLLRLAEAREPRYQEAAHQVDTTGREVVEVAVEVAAIAREAGVAEVAGA
ncbi:MAG TPA: shikimate kinase [Candidatus Solibacter sp.]|nr:shikimate kinase [Candidatus Solibacter sp.]